MPSDADLPEFDEQDQSEVFDEDIMADEGTGPSNDMRTFEELPDVYDVTSRQGDADSGDDLRAADADEIEDEELDDLDLDEDDDEDDDTLDDDFEDAAEDDDSVSIDDDDDLDDVDGIDELEDDEVESTTASDLMEAGQTDTVSDYESEGELSDADVQELGYADPGADGPDDEEDEEVDEAEDDDTHGGGLVGGASGKPAQGHSGEAADLAADRLDKDGELTGHERQQALLDEGVEETFPASDPVSVKRIT